MPVLVDGTVITPPEPPAIRPPSTVLERLGVRSIWTGWDGSQWDLTDPEAGVVMVPGVRGWSMPPIEQYQSTAPSVAGSLNRGNRAADRDDVFWPLFLYSAGSDEDWIDLDAAFWATMDPSKTGTWTIIRPSGVARSIDLRYTSEDAGGDLDPSVMGWNLYALHLTAEQPFWRSDPIVRTFRAFAPAPFFSGPGIVQVNSANQLATATIDNPGDVAGYVIYTLAGPADGYSVGTAGKPIDAPFALGAGEVVSIYTQPEFMFAVDGLGVDRTDDLGPLSVLGSPSAVQPGASVPLTLSMTNPGAGAYIEAALTPYYYRAW